jgi:tight adherence protein B
MKVHPMIGLVASTTAGVGVYLLVTRSPAGRSRDRGWHPLGTARRRVDAWLSASGFESLSTRSMVVSTGVMVFLGAALGLSLFGSPIPAGVSGMLLGAAPLLGARQRRIDALVAAHDAWPRLLEEIRIRTASLGRSIPQALFDVGATAPEEMQPAFAAAHREWLISTDFARTIHVLKTRLADATADVTCETLLIANELGGAGLDRRLEALIDDRLEDVLSRKDARAKQAGVRFARRFVVIVPVGMALAGLSIGNGRASYGTPAGQLGVVIGIGLTALCWIWAGRLMRLPRESRVFES